MNLLKNKMGMRVLTLALCAALGGSVLAVKAESVAGETVVQEAVQDENMSESREIDHPAQEEAEPDGQTEMGETTEESTAQPTDEPTAEPTTEPTQQPTTEPTAEPVPEGAYKITVVSPAKWQKDKATAKINIVDVNGTGWANIRIVVATENGWQTVVDGDDQSAGYAVELRENATIHVSITDHAGNVQAKSEAISCFDSTPPAVRAGVSGEVICIEATDSTSGVAAVYVNGHKLKYSGTTLDANIREYADGRQQIAIYAVDLAGNVSQKVYVKNPFYGRDDSGSSGNDSKPSATKKPSSGGAKTTPKPTATPVPTATPEPTIDPEDPNVTPTPDPENPDVTPEPTEDPEPTPAGMYNDGTYQGSAFGYGGKTRLTVTISGGQIVEITQTNNDTPEFFNEAWNTIYPQIMANQTADGIDTVSGATLSSEGILGAAQKALAQAKK